MEYERNGKQSSIPIPCEISCMAFTEKIIQMSGSDKYSHRSIQHLLHMHIIF